MKYLKHPLRKKGWNPRQPTFRVHVAVYINTWDIWVYPVILPEPKDTQLLVTSVLDDWAMTFLAKGGKVLLTPRKGKILVSGINILPDMDDKRPEARQLLYSLKKYMSGKDFNPSVSIYAEKIRVYSLSTGMALNNLICVGPSTSY